MQPFMPGLDPVQPDICGMNTHCFLLPAALQVTYLLCFVDEEFHVLEHGWKKEDEDLEKTKPRIHLSWV